MISNVRYLFMSRLQASDIHANASLRLAVARGPWQVRIILSIEGRVQYWFFERLSPLSYRQFFPLSLWERGRGEGDAIPHVTTYYLILPSRQEGN